jgi:hypothetical protein
LRLYLDQRWFAAALGQHAVNYLRAIHQAVLEGNLESVLDEWFWLQTRLSGKEGEQLCDEMVAVARLRGSDVLFHDPRRSSKGFTVRAHAALPFIEVRTQDDGLLGEDAKPLRNDELRKAFNSPFLPHVLSTTSVGQEGLDFHPWCKTLVHWDLPANAVDMEQREGRIQRFAGLSVRQAIADRLAKGVLKGIDSHSSVWSSLENEANRKLADRSGMSPWWVLGGANIDRHVLEVPFSQQQSRLEELQMQRGLHRALLGQPHQEDLLAAMVRHRARRDEVGEIDHGGEWTPNLSPHFCR